MPHESITVMHPTSKKFKKYTVKIIFDILARVFSATSKFDESLQKEVSNWPEDLKIVLSVRGTNLFLGLKRTKSAKLIPTKITPEEADAHIMFKNIDSAFMLVTAQMGIPEAYAQKRFIVKGDISFSMSLIRCLNLVQAYLFPRFIARRVIRNIPRIPFIKRYLGRLRLYFLAIPFGI